MIKKLFLVVITLFLVASVAKAATFAVTKVNDGLDDNDMYIMKQGFLDMGYTLSKQDTNTYKSELQTYLNTAYTTIYHTGHGSSGCIYCYDGSICYSSLTLKCTNTIIATCLTLVPTGWKNRFSTSANNICGYTKVSYDAPVDDNCATKLVTNLKAGKKYPYSWYLANNAISQLKDRWCVYARSGSSIVEYSARTGSIPPASAEIDLVSLDEGQRVWASADLLTTDIVSPSPVFSRAFIVGVDKSISESLISDFEDIKFESYLTNDQAVAAVERQVSLPEDAVLDSVLILQCRDESDVISVKLGHIVSYRREIAGAPIRSNHFEDHMVFIVDGNENIVSKDCYWPALKEIRKARVGKALSMADAITIAAPDIARRVKSKDARIRFTSGVTVFGTMGPLSKIKVLIPAYAFISTEGDVVVVNAYTGKVL